MTATHATPTRTPVASSSTPGVAGIVRIVGRVLAAIVVAVGADAIVAAVAHAAGVRNFDPLTPGPYISLTVLGVVGGTIGWALLRRLLARPARVMRWLVPTVLVLSFIPDVAMLFTDAIEKNATGGGVAALIVMHVAVAAVTVGMLRRTLPVD